MGTEPDAKKLAEVIKEMELKITKERKSIDEVIMD